MKIYQIVIALSLIIFSYQACEGSSKKEDCKLSDEEKKNMIIVALQKMVTIKAA